MIEKELLLSLQKGLVKELFGKGLLTEEQTKLAIKKFDSIYEENNIRKEVEKDEKSSSIL